MKYVKNLFIYFLTMMLMFAFSSCSDNITITNESNDKYYDNVYYDEEKGIVVGDFDELIILKVCEITSEDYTLPDTFYPEESSDGLKINYLGDHICTGDENIVNLTIPDTYESIGHFAFYNCPNLESVHIGKSVKIILEDAFASCPKLKRISLSPENPYLYEKDGCILECDTNRLRLSTGNIPYGTKIIGISAFASNVNLSDVIIPNGVEIIEPLAFFQSSLCTVFIPETVTEIQGAAFAKCANLKEIYIPKSVIKLEDSILQAIDGIVINCEAESQPEGWDAEWLKNCTNYTLNWGVEPQPNK